MPAPAPWRVGLAAFAASSLYWADSALGVPPAWVSVGWWAVLACGTTVLIVRWSRRTGWGPRHHLALAGGALLTYVWAGFAHARYLEVSTGTALLGNVVFGAGAVVLLALAVRRRSDQASPAVGAST